MRVELHDLRAVHVKSQHDHRCSASDESQCHHGIIVMRRVAASFEFVTILFAHRLDFLKAFHQRETQKNEHGKREQNGHELKGRGYTAHHYNPVVILGLITGGAAVIVLGLYVNSAQVVKLYAHPQLLLLACPLLLAWICRVWFLTYRGDMHDDPTAFAFTDWVSYLIGALTLAVMWFATGR